jgi:hypothetical protein
MPQLLGRHGRRVVLIVYWFRARVGFIIVYTVAVVRKRPNYLDATDGKWFESGIDIVFGFGFGLGSASTQCMQRCNVAGAMPTPKFRHPIETHYYL